MNQVASNILYASPSLFRIDERAALLEYRRAIFEKDSGVNPVS
jgi:hypothetical protein